MIKQNKRAEKWLTVNWLRNNGLMMGLILLSLIYGCLTYLSHTEPAIGSFMLLVTIAFITLSWVWYRSDEQSVHLITILWVGAIVFRAIGIFALPIYEDDYFRYLWDGYQMATTFNPYQYPPEVFFDNDSAIIEGVFEPILDSINNPNLTTIYGPVCQWIFAIAYWIEPAKLWPLQLIFSCFDLAIIWLLLQLTNTKHVLLYAWSPLVIKEISMTAHTEVLALFFLLSAIVLITQRRMFFIGLISLTLAIASKLFALLAVPFLFFYLPTDIKQKILGILLFSGCLILYYIPALKLLLDSTVSSHWQASGLFAMSNTWLFNAPLYLLATAANLDFIYSKVIIGIIAITAYNSYWLLWFKKRFIIRWDYIFAGMLLILPALNAWYCLWLLLFVAIRPTLWGWVISYAVFFSYCTAQHLSHIADDSLYNIPNWVLLIEFGLVAIAIVLSIYFKLKQITSVQIISSQA